jgi:hypothetical protein
MRDLTGWRSVFAQLLMALLCAARALAASGSNPVPGVTAPLVPASAVPGGASFTLTVNGSGFVAGSNIFWNGSPLKTTFVSSTQVTAQVSSGLIKAAGTVPVTVVNPAPGGGTSNVAFLQITEPSSLAAFSGSSAGTGSMPMSIVAADLRGNGDQDLAVTNDLDNTVSILLGNGNGSFQPQVTYATGLGPEGIAVGDFNRDGKLDLAIANDLAGTVSILSGNGDGTFQSHVDYTTGLEPFGIAAGDFNEDGALDLAVSDQVEDTVSILLGNGDGTFRTHVDYYVGGQPAGLVVCDFNGDDHLDVAVANFATDTISVLSGNGDGTFQAAADYATATGPLSLVAADFNGDGLPDLAVAELLTSQVSFLPGEGKSGFGHRVDYNTGLYPESVAAGDFNGDGILDLALPTDDALGSVSVLLGKGAGAFQASVDFLTGLLPVSLSTADFNADGRLDLASADENSNSASALLESTALLSPASLVFASQNLGTTSTPQTVTLTNAGSQALSISSITASAQFAETNDCGTSLPASESCRIDVTFTPTLPGTLNGTLSVSDGAAGSPQVAGLTGTGTGPLVSLSPSSLNFGNVNVGSVSSSQIVTVSNTGNAALSISSITASSEFGVYNHCPSTLSAGQNCIVSVAFSPTSTGTQTGLLSVADNAIGSPQTVSLMGVGTAPQVSLSPTSLTFATQLVNTVSAPQPVTLTNTGTATLTISSIVTGSNFGQTNSCGGSVKAGGSCVIDVTFSPIGQGSHSGSVLIYDNAAGSPQSVSCTGMGTLVLLVPTSVNFGTIKVGKTSSPKMVLLTNVGTTSMNITSTTIVGNNSADFSQTNTCGKSVGAGATCTFTLYFTPQATGSRTASLSISDNGGGSPQSVSLSGTGN